MTTLLSALAVFATGVVCLWLLIYSAVRYALRNVAVEEDELAEMVHHVLEEADDAK